MTGHIYSTRRLLRHFVPSASAPRINVKSGAASVTPASAAPFACFRSSGNRFSLCTFQFALVLLLTALVFFALAAPALAQEETPQLAPIPIMPEQVVPPPPATEVQPPGMTPYLPSLPPTEMPPIGPTPPPPLPPDEPPPPEDFVTIRADLTRVTPDDEEHFVATAAGNVMAWYRDLVLTSDQAVASTRTGIATFEGNVTFYFRGQTARGERLTLNMRTGEWRVETAATALTPEFFQVPELVQFAERPVVLAPIFLTGQTIFGEDSRIGVLGGSFTTCNLDPPHYTIEAREITIYPDVKLIARGISVYALGRRLLTLPRLAFPLRRIRGRTDIVPQVGQSAEEGYYLRAAYNYLATRDHTGIARLDLMSRKGIAQGLTHTYNLARGAGDLYLYYLNDRNLDATSLTGRLQHRQQVGTVVANVIADLRDNSYQYAPGTTSTNSELRLARDRPGAVTDFGLRQSISRGLGALGSFETVSSSLLHRQDFGPRGVLNVGSDLSQSTSPQFDPEGNLVDATSGQLNSRLDFRRQGDRFDWGVSANWINNLNDEEIFGPLFGGITRQPELTFRTDTFRFGPTLPLGLRANMGLTVGRYREEPAHVETERGLFEFSTMPARYEIANRTTFTASGGFRQYVYGDDVAQYAVNTNALLERRIGDNSSAALTYRFLQPRGFAPFRFDFIGRANVLTGSFNFRETEQFRLSLLSGYDFRLAQNPWQDITIRAFFSPNPIFAAYTSTGYDLNRSRWRNVINQFRIRHPSGFRMDIGTRYDTFSHRFASVRAQVDTPIGDVWRLQGTAGYSGFTRQFDYRSFMLTRDLHCWEASLIFSDQAGFFQEKEVRLNLRIKAFPLFEQFGVGAFGQSLDTSVGDIY